MQGMPPRLVRLGVALLLMAGAGALTAAAAAEGAAAESPAPARKVLVVAKIQQGSKRKYLEEQARDELKKKGVEVVLGSDVMTEADFASEDAIRKKVESLGVDGVLGYVPLEVQESVKTSSATLSVGVGGYSGSGFGMFVGGSVPLGGSQTIVRKVQLRARFWARPFAAPAWEKIYNKKLEDDTTYLSQYLAHDSVGVLKKKKLIPAK